MMDLLVRSFEAESLKYRRTSAAYLAAAVPALLILLAFLVFSTTAFYRDLPPDQEWDRLSLFIFAAWLNFALPIGSAILTALACGLEYANNHAKHVLALPPSRGSFFAAKFVAVVVLLLVGTLVLALGFAGAGIVLGFSEPIPLREVLGKPVLALALLWPSLALFLWVSLRFKSFALTAGLGLMAAMVGTLATSSDRWWPFVPFSYPLRLLADDPSTIRLALILAVAVGVPLTLLGWWSFARRDVL